MRMMIASTTRMSSPPRCSRMTHSRPNTEKTVPQTLFSVFVTDPLGTARTYNFQTILGVVKTTGVSEPCPSCGGSASQATTYDANGNIASKTDFNNKKSCMAYDLSRNLVTSRVEGLLAAEACATALTTPPNRADVRKTTTT